MNEHKDVIEFLQEKVDDMERAVERLSPYGGMAGVVAQEDKMRIGRFQQAIKVLEREGGDD